MGAKTDNRSSSREKMSLSKSMSWALVPFENDLLTAGCLAVVEDLRYLGVHQDHAFFLSALFVSLVHPQVDLGLEILPDEGIDHVGDVASGQLQPLPLENGQRHHHLWFGAGVDQELLHSEAFEVGDVDGFDLGLDDPGALACDNVSHVKNGDCLEGWQVRAAVMGQEAVNLSLGLVLGAEGGGVITHLLSCGVRPACIVFFVLHLDLNLNLIVLDLILILFLALIKATRHILNSIRISISANGFLWRESKSNTPKLLRQLIKYRKK
jgi:hypothetical protein